MKAKVEDNRGIDIEVPKMSKKCKTFIGCCFLYLALISSACVVVHDHGWNMDIRTYIITEFFRRK